MTCIISVTHATELDICPKCIVDMSFGVRTWTHVLWFTSILYVYMMQLYLTVQGKQTVRTTQTILTTKKSVDILKARMEEHILGSASARSEMIRRRLNGNYLDCVLIQGISEYILTCTRKICACNTRTIRTHGIRSQYILIHSEYSLVHLHTNCH